MRTIASILLLLLVSAMPAEAREIHAFIEGMPAPHYDELIWNARPGDVLVLSGPTKTYSFRIKSRIYPSPTSFQGTQNIIFELSDGRALRVPRSSDKTESITEFLAGYRDLLRQGIQFMDVDLKQSQPGIFAIHEKLNIRFTLANFLKSGKIGTVFEGVSTGELKTQLLRFAEQLKDFQELGDFELTQVGWAGGRWVLFDYGFPHFRAGEKSTETLFSPYARAKLSTLSPAGQAMIREINSRILEMRMESCLRKSLGTSLSAH